MSGPTKVRRSHVARLRHRGAAQVPGLRDFGARLRPLFLQDLPRTLCGSSRTRTRAVRAPVRERTRRPGSSRVMLSIPFESHTKPERSYQPIGNRSMPAAQDPECDNDGSEQESPPAEAVKPTQRSIDIPLE